ncbi:MAG: chemotaxis protein CheW [Pseudomonadota bacterium]
MASKQLLRPSEALNRRFFRAETQSEDDEQQSGGVTRRLGFRLGGLGFLLDEHAISELADFGNICAVPNTASWLLGLINLRGNLVPVFDIVRALDLPTPNEKKRMLLILGQGEEAAGLLIDELPAHQFFSQEEKLESLPAMPDAIKSYILSAYQKEDALWFDFDHSGYLASLTSKVAV